MKPRPLTAALLTLACLWAVPSLSADDKPKDGPKGKPTAPPPPSAGQPAKLGSLTFNTAYSARFAVFVKGSRAEPVAECGERVYDAMMKWNPHFGPTLDEGLNDALIPVFTVYSRADQNSFKTWYFPILQKAGAGPDAITQMQAMWDKISGTQVSLDAGTATELKCFQRGTFLNMESAKNKNDAMAPFRVHNMAATLQNFYLDPILKSKEGAADDLLWLTAGFTFFAEIRLGGAAETHILDYETMPDPKDKTAIKPQSYADGKHWPENVKKLARAKKTALPVAKILQINMASLSPDQLAFAFAFQDYLHSTPEISQKFYDYLHEVRAKPELPEINGLIKALGHPDADTLDKAFWEFLKSPAFKQ